MRLHLLFIVKLQLCRKSNLQQGRCTPPYTSISLEDILDGASTFAWCYDRLGPPVLGELPPPLSLSSIVSSLSPSLHLDCMVLARGSVLSISLSSLEHQLIYKEEKSDDVARCNNCIVNTCFTELTILYKDSLCRVVCHLHTNWIGSLRAAQDLWPSIQVKATESLSHGTVSAVTFTQIILNILGKAQDPFKLKFGSMLTTAAKYLQLPPSKV